MSLWLPIHSALHSTEAEVNLLSLQFAWSKKSCFNPLFLSALRRYCSILFCVCVQKCCYRIFFQGQSHFFCKVCKTICAHMQTLYTHSTDLNEYRKDKLWFGFTFCHILSFFSNLEFSGLCAKLILYKCIFLTSLWVHIYFLPAAYCTVSHSKDGIILSKIITLNYSREACRCKTCCFLMQILGF